MPEGLEIVSVRDARTNEISENYDQDTDTWTVGTLEPNEYALLVIEAKAVKAGNLTNHAVISTTSDENYFDNNEGNATVIVEGDEPPEVNSPEDEEVEKEETEPSPEKEKPTQETEPSPEKEKPTQETEPAPEKEKPTPEEESFGNTTNSKEVAPKSIEVATGNPVMLVLIALLVITENIFRRKK